MKHNRLIHRIGDLTELFYSIQTIIYIKLVPIYVVLHYTTHTHNRTQSQVGTRIYKYKYKLANQAMLGLYGDSKETRWRPYKYILVEILYNQGCTVFQWRCMETAVPVKYIMS